MQTELARAAVQKAIKPLIKGGKIRVGNDVVPHVERELRAIGMVATNCDPDVGPRGGRLVLNIGGVIGHFPVDANGNVGAFV